MVKRVVRIIAVIIFIIVVAALCVVVYAVPKIQGLAMQTEIVEYADLPVKDTVEGLVVRNETLYLAASSGSPDYLVGEGTKVRRGTQVFWVDTSVPPPSEPEGASDTLGDGKADLDKQDDQEEKDDTGAKEAESDGGGNGDSEDSGTTVESGSVKADLASILEVADGSAQTSEGGIAPTTAIVSYYADGWEARITPETMWNLNSDIMKELPAESVDLTREWIRAGDPAYKITDNNLWYLAFWKEAEDDEKIALPPGTEDAGTGKDTVLEYAKGTKVTLDLGTTFVTATVDSVTRQGAGWFVVLRSDMYYKDLVKYRKLDVTVIFAEYEGAVIGENAVKERDGRPGVYVKQQSGTWKWIPVNILKTADGKHLVSENTFNDADGNKARTINYYDEVMSDPEEEGY
jgi:putative membrane fusion protein